MCGILAVFGLTGSPQQNRRELLKLSKLLRHRGPDANSAWSNAAGDAWLLHERLVVVDVTDAGRQPFVLEGEGGQVAWCMNSEIYNHEQLRDEQLAGVHIGTKSDSAVFGHLYKRHGGVTNEMLNSLDGIFAAALYDEATGEYTVARDPIGICPLYWGQGADGAVWFASEMKALQDNCVEFDIFPPGHVYRSSTGTLERWYNPKWLEKDHIPSTPVDLKHLRESLEAAVVKRLMSDVPLGVLLSGGLDSSLVASIASRHFASTKNAYHEAGSNKLHTFSIGIEGSPDHANARKVAHFLGTVHHEFTFTVQDGLDAVADLIWHIESFEQVRAAVPMYLLARKIKALGIKVVMSGEGADEAFGGYLYFHKAPNAEEFHRETVRKVERLHQWDVMRANKACFAFGLEPRVPFLDRGFLDVAMAIDPAAKMCDRNDRPDGVHPRSEKYLLRKAFDTPEDPYLPEEVLWRQKEQFSDGVGYDWVDGLKDYAAEVVTDEMWEARSTTFPIDPPKTREYYLLRSIFQSQFPSASALHTVPRGLSVACSTPEAVAWDPAWENLHEISGRAVMDVHDAGEGYTAGASEGAGAPKVGVSVNGKGPRGAVVAKAAAGRGGASAGVSRVVVPKVGGFTRGGALGQRVAVVRGGAGAVRRF